MNFQAGPNGTAKAYQMRQLVAAIEELGSEANCDVQLQLCGQVE
jgi:hypothetical protein